MVGCLQRVLQKLNRSRGTGLVEPSDWVDRIQHLEGKTGRGS